MVLQCEAAGGQVPGHLRGGLVVRDGRGVHGRNGTAVCGAGRLGGAAAAVGAAGLLDLHLLRHRLLRRDVGHSVPARLTGDTPITALQKHMAVPYMVQ